MMSTPGCKWWRTDLPLCAVYLSDAKARMTSASPGHIVSDATCTGVAMNMRRHDMTNYRFARMAIAAVGLLCATHAASAQSGTAQQHVPLQKTIGQGKPQVVPSLFVLNSSGVSSQGGKLVMTGVAPNSIVFADRPVRAAGHDLTSRIVDDWAKGSDNFAQDPPNATIS